MIQPIIGTLDIEKAINDLFVPFTVFVFWRMWSLRAFKYVFGHRRDILYWNEALWILFILCYLWIGYVWKQISENSIYSVADILIYISQNGIICFHWFILRWSVAIRVQIQCMEQMLLERHGTIFLIAFHYTYGMYLTQSTNWQTSFSLLFQFSSVFHLSV